MRLLSTVCMASLTLVAGFKGSAFAQSADTVYTNGKIYTVNKAQPWASAVAIKDGKIIAVGSSDDVKAHIAEATAVIDMNGGFAMPGIHDTHIHTSLVYSHAEAGRLLFAETNSPDKVIEIPRNLCRTLEFHRADELITFGYDQANRTLD